MPARDGAIRAAREADIRLQEELQMHIHTMATWQHSHPFGEADARAEQRTRWVVAITGGTMVAEIIVGWLSGSMALLADGWHMGTHMFALGIAAFAYRFARLHSDDPVFTFGTGKVASLAGFTSAIVLGLVAMGMVAESVSRLINPSEIHFVHAIIVAAIGLAVNVGSALLLHDVGHDEHGHHHDHNRRAAFIHVLADALTSLLAMVALVAVHFWNLRWMDPAVALLGAALITVWAIGLLRDTSRTLVDAGVSADTTARIRQALESDADNRVSDLHVWQVGSDALSVAANIVTHYPRPAEHYRGLLRAISEIKHSTIEITACGGEPCIPIDGEQERNREDT
jgi:cation diffusion facilitator family transporter